MAVHNLNRIVSLHKLNENGTLHDEKAYNGSSVHSLASATETPDLPILAFT